MVSPVDMYSRSDLGRNGIGWLFTTQSGENAIQEYFYYTSVSSIFTGTGYTYTAAYTGFIGYDMITGTPRWLFTYHMYYYQVCESYAAVCCAFAPLNSAASTLYTCIRPLLISL
jgi:hypothetical protein